METMNPETANGRPSPSNQKIGARTSERRLSLYEIETVLSDLVALRVEMTQTGEDTSAVDEQITDYINREISKADGIVAYIKHCALLEAEAKKESAAMMARSRSWAERGAHLKMICVRVMNLTGRKKIEGRLHALSLRGNGGVEPLVITDAEMIPEGLCDYHVTIPGDLWCALLREAPQALLDIIGTRSKTERVPNNGRIRAEMEMPCPQCGGDGRMYHEQPVVDPVCAECGGTGKRLVAGARLENRGESLVCK